MARHAQDTLSGQHHGRRADLVTRHVAALAVLLPRGLGDGMHPGDLAGLRGFLPDHLLRNGVLDHPPPAGMAAAALHADVRAVGELGIMGRGGRAAGLHRNGCPWRGMASAAVHPRLVRMTICRRARMAGSA